MLVNLFRYPVPCRPTIKKVIGKKYEVEQQKIKKRIDDCKEGVATTTDGWTSIANDGYLSLTGHGINDQWELIAFCIDIIVLTERHTGEHLAEALSKLFDEWGMDKSIIPAIVTDSAPNIRKAARILDIPNPPCFGHNLQLGVRAGLEHELVAVVVKKSKEMVTFIHHSSVACSQVKTIAKASGISITTLQQECPTRWGSALGMFESVETLKIPVTTVLFQEKRELLPDDQFWIDLHDLIAILKPMAAITARMSGEAYPTMSYVYPILIDIVSNKLVVKESDSPMIKGFKTAMLEKINIVFDKEEVRDLMQVASVLDPRFKHLGFLKPSAQRQAYSLLKEKAEDLGKPDPSPAPSPSNSPPEKRTRNDEGTLEDEDVLIFGSLCLNAMQKDSSRLPKGKTEIDIEIDNYKKEKGCSSLKDCPLQWWKKRQHQFPNLSRLAKRYLAIPATSVKSERLFSDGTNTVTKKRASLLPESAIELIVLHANRNK